MRRKTIFLACAVFAVALSGGCGRPGSEQKAVGPAADEPKPSLPSFLAGTWQAQDSPWKIVLAPDGSVVSALVPMGAEVVRPNLTTEFEMQDGTLSHVTGGEFFAEYGPTGRQLSVSIEIKDIHISFPGDAIDGNSTDFFTGPVSEDGKTWDVNWFSIFNYGPRFPQDENDIYPEPLVFKKIEE